jgi:hypothetical protein
MMLKCRVQKFVFGIAHTLDCVDCAEQSQHNALIESLLTDRARRINQESHTPSPFFAAKLNAQLRAETQPLALTWEHAVPALRGWMFAFSAAALLLIAAAVSLSANSHPPEENVFTASANESAQTDALWTGD